ncbi:MAG: C/D box methylation guide ribonucleoprotein complex aNOP56 subunit, partial [Candidatus Altiarchaeota archaeon]
FILRDGKVIKQKLFAGDIIEIAKKLRQTEDSYCGEEAELIREMIETGNKKLLVNNPTRFQGSGFNITFLQEKERPSVYKIATEMYLNRHDVDSLIRKVNRAMSRERLMEVDRDQILMQAVNSLDDIDEAVNRLVERLREWYSIHYPELDHIIASQDTYARLVSEVGERGRFQSESLGIEPNMADKLIAASKDSLGVEFTEEDLKAVKALAEPIIKLHVSKAEIESYIGKLMVEIAPNINELAGPLLGAKLIALAHGLKRLSTLPAGTIQLVGAEDAFFRFLKTGKKPPKHGIIFQLPAIRNAKRDVRGKISRNFAAKVALASRSDAFKGSFQGDKLKKDFEKRVKSLS